MSDLISRSALLEEIKRELERGRANDPFFDGTLFHYTGIKAIIENQPTAYDVDKVVKELKAKMKNICGSYNRETPILESPSCKVAFNNGICEAIETVKGGGVNERTL